MSEKKINLFLDLDETIIFGIPFDTMKIFEKNLNEKDKQKYSNLIKKSGGLFSKDIGYTIIPRPGLDSFLDFVFKNFSVSVWTAASKDYGKYIIDNFIEKNGRKLQYYFFLQHCEMSAKLTNQQNDKKLDILSKHFNLKEFDLDQTFLLDDNINNYDTQEKNCLRCLPFVIMDLDETNSNYDNIKCIGLMKKQLENIANDNFLEILQKDLEKLINNKIPLKKFIMNINTKNFKEITTQKSNKTFRKKSCGRSKSSVSTYTTDQITM